MSESIDLENKIVDFIDSYYDLHGFLPSVRTIADGVGSNKSTVQRTTARLREEGILFDSNIGVVTQRIDKLQKDSVMVGLVGSVSCGPLTFAEQNISEYFTLPTSLVGKGEFFLLQASGDSMIDAGIDSGDLVLIKKQSTAEFGQIVVALVDNETTLKRLKKNKSTNEIYLHPENSDYDDIYLDSDLIIQGVAVKVLKDLL